MRINGTITYLRIGLIDPEIQLIFGDIQETDLDNDDVSLAFQNVNNDLIYIQGIAKNILNVNDNNEVFVSFSTDDNFTINQTYDFYIDVPDDLFGEEEQEEEEQEEEEQEEEEQEEEEVTSYYQKRNQYPSYKKPGGYPLGSMKELGLNNDDLEKFSLGNWNSIVKDNKLLITNASEIDIDERGRPVQLAFDDDTFTGYNPNETLQRKIVNHSPLISFLIRKDSDGRIKDIRQTLNRDFHPNNSRDEDGNFSDDDEFDYYVPKIYYGAEAAIKNVGDLYRAQFERFGYDESIYEIDGESFPNERRNSLGMKALIPLQYGTGASEIANRQDQIKVLNHYCLTNEDQELDDLLTSAGKEIPDDMVQQSGPKYAYKFFGLKSQYKISFDDGFGYIQPKSDDYLDKPQRGPIDILLDENLLEKYRNLFFEIELTPPGQGYFENRNDDADTYEGYFDFRIFFPRVIGMKTQSTSFSSTDYSTDYPLLQLGGNRSTVTEPGPGAPSRTVFLGPRVNVPVKVPYQGEFNPYAFGSPDSWTEENTNLGTYENQDWYDIGDYQDDDFGIRPNPLPFVTPERNIVRAFYNDNAILNNDSPEKWSTLGAPLFKPNEELILGSLNNSVGYENLDFIVDCVASDSNEVPLYYDEKNKLTLYNSTSYPLKVSLKILLQQNIDFENSINVDEFNFSPSDLMYRQTITTSETDASFTSFENSEFYINQIASASVEDSHYRYKVIQWGDEKNQLTDEQIESTYYFNIYDRDSYPNINDYSFKKIGIEQAFNFTPIETVSNHVYNTPGIKNIKIVIVRLTRDGSITLQSYLVTKNIVINDGNILSQDFSIFGGTDFNFLPIRDNQAIIGGFDEDSKFNNSVSKIVKDDNFVREDYLERVSSKDYIQKFNSGLLGETPGQLDLSQTRVFKESKDIYDFIGGDKLEWINNGSGSLPLNSLATDIFIRDEKCVVDLNPANSEFTTIQNQMGTKELGILIGDYKVNQPKDSRVQKQGVMQTPLLETDNDKQAF